MQLKSAATLCVLAVVLLACSRNGPPSSLFESAGYHVRDNKVYYLNAFPGKAFEIADADAATFESLDSTYGWDRSSVYVSGAQLPDADAASFELLDRPGFAKDRHAVYWSDGSVLSNDPEHFAIIATADHYLFTKDAKTVHVNGNAIPDANPATFELLRGAYARDDRQVIYFADQIVDADLSTFRPLDGPYASDSGRVYWMGKTIDGADPNTFRVLNVDFECSADATRAYYRQAAIAGADLRTFAPDRAVINCSETSISFAE